MVCNADMLQAYCQAANLEAATVLPCVLDAGTNDVELQKVPRYIGCKSATLQGSALHEVRLPCALGLAVPPIHYFSAL